MAIRIPTCKLRDSPSSSSYASMSRAERFQIMYRMYDGRRRVTRAECERAAHVHAAVAGAEGTTAADRAVLSLCSIDDDLVRAHGAVAVQLVVGFARVRQSLHPRDQTRIGVSGTATRWIGAHEVRCFLSDKRERSQRGRSERLFDSMRHVRGSLACLLTSSSL